MATVRLTTSKGPLEIELYAKELPVLCRAFLEHCSRLEYLSLTFPEVTSTRVLLLLLPGPAQALAKESHSRLKFTRGAVGLAAHTEPGKFSAAGFFICLDAPPPGNLYIGHVTTATLYTALDMAAVELKPDSAEPMYPITVTGISVLQAFFDNLPLPPKQQKQKKRPAVLLGYDEPDSLVIKPAHDFIKRRKEKLDGKGIPEEKEIEEKKQEERTKEAKERDDTKSDPEGGDIRTPTKSDEVHDKPDTKETSLETTTTTQKPLVKTPEALVTPISDNAQTSVTTPDLPNLNPKYDPLLDIKADTVTYEQLISHKYT